MRDAITFPSGAGSVSAKARFARVQMFLWSGVFLALALIFWRAGLATDTLNDLMTHGGYCGDNPGRSGAGPTLLGHCVYWWCALGAGMAFLGLFGAGLVRSVFARL